MTQHTLTYIHNKRKRKCKGVPQEAVAIEEQQEEQIIVKSPRRPPGLQKQTSINPTNPTNDINQHIQEHPNNVSTYLRNEQPLKAQRKQMCFRSVLKNACLT